MECDLCGSRNVQRREIEGNLLEECQLCGNLQGDDEAVALIEDLRAGRERGLDDEIIPLVSVLESIGAFRIVQASGGDAGRSELPYVFLALAHGETSYIERLLRSLEMANRDMTHLWLIELSLQHGVVYILRPRFWKPPASITQEEIRDAQADLRILSRRLRRDLSLSWWRV
ncbi:MAG: hypothetical protein ACYSUN_04360 [Planctomycetota bacterium]